MNRRGFLGSVAGIGGLGVAEAVGPTPSPVPSGIEEASWCQMDFCQLGVGEALVKLGWSSDAATMPVLCVSAADYPAARFVVKAYAGLLEVRALADVRDTWYVEWRGRRVGSVGA